MSATIQDLITSLDEEIKNNMHRLIDNRGYADEISEMVDGWIPDNHGELAEMLCNDTGLASVDDPGMLGENPTVWDIIQGATRERLLASGMQEFEDLKVQYEEDKDELEAAGYELDYEKREYRVMLLDIEEVEEPSLLKGGFKSEYEAVQWWINRPEEGEENEQ
jgi:hypothetical protein